MPIIKHHKNDNYSVIDNHCARNESLSLKAKGLFFYLMTLPPDWYIKMSEIKDHSTDGKDSHRSAMLELIKARYVKRESARSDHGEFDGWIYHISEQPITEGGFSACGSSACGESATTKYLDILSTESTNKIYVPVSDSKEAGHSQNREETNSTTDDSAVQAPPVASEAETTHKTGNESPKPLKRPQQAIPSLDEVRKYCREVAKRRGIPPDSMIKAGEDAHAYYEQIRTDSNGRVWKDNRGTTIKDWKRKLSAVWFKNVKEKQERISKFN